MDAGCPDLVVVIAGIAGMSFSEDHDAFGPDR